MAEFGKWTEPSEELPEENIFILVQVVGRHGSINFCHATQTAMYDDRDGWWIEAYPEWKNPTVEAWMPLPPQFKKS